MIYSKNLKRLKEAFAKTNFLNESIQCQHLKWTLINSKYILPVEVTNMARHNSCYIILDILFDISVIVAIKLLIFSRLSCICSF